jgi:large subunit ribosomal protein L1
MSKNALGSKRHRANLEHMPAEPVDAAAAVATLKKYKGVKFDQTVNIVMHLGIDTKQADQALRGSIALPKGIGKTKRVIAFCQSDVAPKALAAGAIKAGGEDLVAEVEKGFLDFDVAIASPDMMRVMAKLGKVLGPKGLMPSPKAGTVTPNVADAVKEYAAGKVEFRADTGGNVHGVIGKMSFPEKDLVENLEFFIKAIEKVKPQTSKGQYVKRIVIAGAMTPGVPVKYVTEEVEE